MERHRTETAPPADVPYTEDAPHCKDCGEYFFHDWEEGHYTCHCPHSIKASEIQFSPFNAAGKFSKSLDELAKQSSSYTSQQQQSTDSTTIKTASSANNASSNSSSNRSVNRSRIVTERGASSSSGVSSYGAGSTTGGGVFQSFHPRDNLKNARATLYNTQFYLSYRQKKCNA